MLKFQHLLSHSPFISLDYFTFQSTDKTQVITEIFHIFSSLPVPTYAYPLPFSITSHLLPEINHLCSHQKPQLVFWILSLTYSQDSSYSMYMSSGFSLPFCWVPIMGDTSRRSQDGHQELGVLSPWFLPSSALSPHHCSSATTALAPCLPYFNSH